MDPVKIDPYKPRPWHWFYVARPEKIWTPFTQKQSDDIEKMYFALKDGSVSEKYGSVSLEGGRYFIAVSQRKRIASADSNETHATVQRCLWFYNNQGHMSPYSEKMSEMIEEEYRNGKVTEESNFFKQKIVQRGFDGFEIVA